MLADSQVQVVSLSVPPSVQPRLICQAAQHGKHVFCEKPLGIGLLECREAVREVEEAGIQGSVNYFFPRLHAWRVAKQHWEALGPLRHGHLTWFIRSRAFEAGAHHWKTLRDQGGGTLYNFVSHAFFTLEWFFGPIATVFARETQFPDPQLQAGLHLILGLDSGASLSVNVAADAIQGSGHRLEAYGEKGSLSLHNNSGDFARGFELSVADTRGARVVALDPLAGQGDGRLEVTKDLIGDFVDRLGSEQPVWPNLRDGLRVQRLLEAARRSLQEREEVFVGIEQGKEKTCG